MFLLWSSNIFYSVVHLIAEFCFATSFFRCMPPLHNQGYKYSWIRRCVIPVQLTFLSPVKHASGFFSISLGACFVVNWFGKPFIISTIFSKGNWQIIIPAFQFPELQPRFDRYDRVKFISISGSIGVAVYFRRGKESDTVRIVAGVGGHGSSILPVRLSPLRLILNALSSETDCSNAHCSRAT